jgi:hypothetical protein
MPKSRVKYSPAGGLIPERRNGPSGLWIEGPPTAGPRPWGPEVLSRGHQNDRPGSEANEICKPPGNHIPPVCNHWLSPQTAIQIFKKPPGPKSRGHLDFISPQRIVLENHRKYFRNSSLRVFLCGGWEK